MICRRLRATNEGIVVDTSRCRKESQDVAGSIPVDAIRPANVGQPRRRRRAAQEQQTPRRAESVSELGHSKDLLRRTSAVGPFAATPKFWYGGRIRNGDDAVVMAEGRKDTLVFRKASWRYEASRSKLGPV